MREIQASEAKTHLPNFSMTSSVGRPWSSSDMARIVPEMHLRQAEVDRAFPKIKALRQRTGKITVDELASAEHPGHKC
jgi:hypothetical protein